MAKNKPKNKGSESWLEKHPEGPLARRAARPEHPQGQIPVYAKRDPMYEDWSREAYKTSRQWWNKYGSSLEGGKEGKWESQPNALGPMKGGMDEKLWALYKKAGSPARVYANPKHANFTPSGEFGYEDWLDWFKTPDPEMGETGLTSAMADFIEANPEFVKDLWANGFWDTYRQDATWPPPWWGDISPKEQKRLEEYRDLYGIGDMSPIDQSLFGEKNRMAASRRLATGQNAFAEMLRATPEWTQYALEQGMPYGLNIPPQYAGMMASATGPFASPAAAGYNYEGAQSYMDWAKANGMTDDIAQYLLGLGTAPSNDYYKPGGTSSLPGYNDYHLSLLAADPDAWWKYAGLKGVSQLSSGDPRVHQQLEKAHAPQIAALEGKPYVPPRETTTMAAPTTASMPVLPPSFSAQQTYPRRFRRTDWGGNPYQGLASVPSQARGLRNMTRRYY